MDSETFRILWQEIEDLQMEGGIELTMLISLSDELSNLISWMLRVNRFTADELSQYLALDVCQANIILHSLKEKGIIQISGHSIQDLYEPITKPKQDKVEKGLSKSIWEKLE